MDMLEDAQLGKRITSTIYNTSLINIEKLTKLELRQRKKAFDLEEQ